MEKKKKIWAVPPGSPSPPSSPQPSQQILSEESAPPPGISAERNAAREGEGGWRGRGIFDVSLSEDVDFHMVEGGGRACELGWKLGPSFRAQRGGPGPRTRRCSPGGSRAPAGPPPPAGPLRDTPRLAAGHLWARHVLPPRPAPRAPPRLGAVTGGRGGTRRARRLEARVGERGAAGRSGRPGVWASVAPVSRSPRGAPWPGVGRVGGIRSPRRLGGAVRTVWCPRRDGDRSAWDGPVTGRKVGPRVVPTKFPKSPIPVPLESQSTPAWYWEDRAGRSHGAVGGEASRTARLELELFESRLPPCHP